jgi:L-ascorbate metabolism protein UlaG (beta-lactamase superfamily)
MSQERARTSTTEEAPSMDLHGLQITWLGHGTFKLRTAAGKTLLIDPWVQDNPACPAEAKHLGKLDVLLATHGHFDHIGNAIAVAKESQPEQVIGIFELCAWLESKGVQNTIGMNKGGTLDLGWVTVTAVHAEHSCGITDGDTIIYGGEAVGYVLRFDTGLCLYAAGDTGVFGDMRIIGDLYQPQVAILPIGDLYTMGPREAAYATRLLGVAGVIPAHYGTFPALTGTPARLRDELAALEAGQIEITELRPGATYG